MYSNCNMYCCKQCYSLYCRSYNVRTPFQSPSLDPSFVCLGFVVPQPADLLGALLGVDAEQAVAGRDHGNCLSAAPARILSRKGEVEVSTQGNKRGVSMVLR